MKVVLRDAPILQPALHEVAREEIHAAGPVQRGWLHERVRRRTGASRDEVVGAVDELERAGDLLAGHGLVGPAPLRAVPLPGSGALLIGSRPGRFLDVETSEDLPRRVSTPPAEALEVSLERWTQLDRAPVADQTFLDALVARDTHDDGEDWTEAYGWRNGKFRPEPPTSGLWRLRMHGRWFRYAWVDEAGRRPMRTDEGLRAAFALARRDGGTPVTVEHSEGRIVLRLPRLPRPEYRLVTACAARQEDWSWRVPLSRWSDLKTTLSSQLGLCFEDDNGKT